MVLYKIKNLHIKLKKNKIKKEPVELTTGSFLYIK